MAYLSRHPAPTFLAGIPELPGTPQVVLLHQLTTPESPIPGQPQTQPPIWTPRNFTLAPGSMTRPDRSAVNVTGT